MDEMIKKFIENMKFQISSKKILNYSGKNVGKNRKFLYYLNLMIVINKLQYISFDFTMDNQFKLYSNHFNESDRYPIGNERY